MQEIYQERDSAIARISGIVDKLITGNNLYKKRLDKEVMTQHLARFVDKFSPEYLKTIPDDELTNIIDRTLVIEAVSETLNELTPDQMKMFDQAVEGR